MGRAQAFLKVLILALVCCEAFNATFASWMNAFAGSAHPRAAVTDRSALAFYSQADYFCATIGDRMDGTLGDTNSALRCLSSDEYQHFALESLKRSDCRGAALYASDCLWGRLWNRLQLCGPWVRDPLACCVCSVIQELETADRLVKAMPELIEDTIHPRTNPRTVKSEVRPNQWREVATP